jgi:hypothetical protein
LKLTDEELSTEVVPYNVALDWIVLGSFQGEKIKPEKLSCFTHDDMTFKNEFAVLDGKLELASEFLTSFLVDKKIKSYGRKLPFNKEEEYFEKAHKYFEKIDPELFKNGEWNDGEGDWEDGDTFTSATQAYVDIMINSDDLRSHFRKKIDENPTLDYQAHILKSQFNPVERRGRKPKFKWEEFLTEIIVRADLDALPEKQADLEKEMASWCLDKWGEEPSNSMIRKRISAIYNHHRKSGLK